MVTESNRFEKPIQNAIVKFRAENAADRAKVYAAARASLRRVQNGKDSDADELEAAIASVESSFTRTRPRARLRIPRPIAMSAGAFVVGGILGAAVATYLAGAAPAGGAGSLRQLAKPYDRGVASLPEASAFLNEIVDVVVDRQKRNHSAFAKSAKGFISLAKFDADLAGRMPKSLPRGTAVIVRADAYNFKILMNWTLCGVASIAKPEMVDRVRAPDMFVGCPYFGLWSAGAATW